MRVALHVSPHPDDELIGAGATLLALRDAGWRIVNLACGLGRAADHERRRAELVEACRRACFELEIAEEPVALGREDDLLGAREELGALIADAVARHHPRLLIGPSPWDGHHAHEAVGGALADALRASAGATRAMFWGLWADLPEPTVLVAFEQRRLEQLQHALAAHAGELARNDYQRLVRARAEMNAVLGPERVFGFGSAGRGPRYAELLSEVRWEPEVGLVHEAPREIDASVPPPPS